VLSLDKPRAFLYRNFMTDAEVEHMIEISKNGLSKSGVVDATTGGSTISDIRTSSGAFVGRGSTPIVTRIEERIALWSQIPTSHGEAIQVLRYEGGQEYRAHFDYFFHKQGMANNRVATVLLYLSDVEEGGETVFPNAPALGDRAALQANWSACARQGLAVKPVKGNALLFWSMKVGGELDGGSSHAGCPVIKGTKWTATKWMHVGDSNAWNVDHKVYKEPRPSARPGCEDKDDRCWSWAEQGECKKNAGFMAETCKASCGCGEEEE
jgi:prolyl 4-hydroxylase